MKEKIMTPILDEKKIMSPQSPKNSNPYGSIKIWILSPPPMKTVKPE